MKRIICIVFAIGIGLSSFAGGGGRAKDAIAKKDSASSVKPSADDQLQITDGPQKMTVEGFKTLLTGVGGQVESILEAMRAVVVSNDSLKADTNRLGETNRQLEAQRREVEDLLTNDKSCRMLIKYPLMEPYDSILIAQSLKLIEMTKVAEKQGDNEYCKDMIPVLKKYSAYYQEIRNLVKRILEYYVSVGQPYSIRDFQRTYEEKSYYKECSSMGKRIPFLEDVRNEIEMFILEERLTEGNLKALLEKMK